LYACGDDTSDKSDGSELDADSGMGSDADDASRDGERGDGAAPSDDAPSDDAPSDDAPPDDAPSDDAGGGEDDGVDTGTTGDAEDDTAAEDEIDGDGSLSDGDDGGVNTDDSASTEPSLDAGMGLVPGPDSPPSIAAYRSGARLRATVLSDGNGAEQFVRFYDTELERRCSFQVVRQGDESALYCFTAGFSIELFADAECTQRVVSPLSECSPFAIGELVTVPVPSEEPCASIDILTLTAGMELAPDALYSRSSGQCQEATVNPEAEYFEGTPADLSGFVRGTERVDVVEPETGFEVSYIDGEDGSSVRQDQAIDGKTCFPERIADGDPLCAPSDAAHWGGTFLDDQCSETPAAEAVVDECRPAPGVITVYERDADGCTSLTGFVAPGAATEGTHHFLDGNGTCTEQTGNDGTFFYELGDALAPASFPQLQDEQIGSGVLRVRSYSSSDGRSVGDARWFHSELGVGCQPVIVSDGSRRCIPDWNSYAPGVYFSDAACTTELYYTGSSCGPARDTDYAVYTDARWDDALDRCTTHADRIVELARYSGPMYRLTFDVCEEAEAVSGLFAEGRESVPEDFPLLELVER
jgi:hypothetical protein